MIKYVSLAVTLLLSVAHFSIAQKALKPNSPKKAEQKVADVPPGWLKKVKQNIRQREYYIRKKAGGNTWHSPNRAQNLHFTYKPGQVRMQPLTNKSKGSDWHLDLKTIGLYADDEKVKGTRKEAKAQVEDSMAVFRHGPMKIQYLNRKQGMRQNFIVEELEDQPETLEVKLQSKGLKVKQSGKAELQFFKEETDKKQLTYEDLKVWDAKGRILKARFETKGQNIHIRVNADNAEYPITIDPLSKTPDWVAKGGRSYSNFGRSVSTAGDVNGDGYDDVIVGIYASGPNRGDALVYHGSANGLSQVANWKLPEVPSNNIVTVTSVSSAGDVNGDGYDDVIVSAPTTFMAQNSGRGRALVFLGGANGLSQTADWVIENDQKGADYDWRVAKAGDINGDGFSDVIVGSRHYSNDQTEEGRALVFYGSSNGLSQTADWIVEGDQTRAFFGYDVSSAGDVNGDGYDDVVIGARGYRNDQFEEGRAFVYYGSANGLNQSPNWTVDGNQEEANLGSGVSTAGDVNGDGYDDVIVGAYGYSGGQQQEGAAFVYFGSGNGLSQSADWMVEGNQEDANLGWDVSNAGDFNGDGIDDIMVSAPYYTNGQKYEGRTYLYYGSGNGLDQAPDWEAESNQEDASFGKSISAAGNVNGDKFDDVIIGAPNYETGQQDEGRAYVFHGFCKGPPTPENNSIETRIFSKNPPKDSIVTYSIDSVERADTIKWNFPSDWTIQNQQGDTSILVKVGTAGEICITPANDCGEADTCLEVEPVNPNISDTTACEGDTIKIGPFLPTVQSIEWNTKDTTEKILVDTSGTYAYEAVMKDSTIYRDTAQVNFAPRPHVYVGPDSAFCGKIDYRIEPETKNAETYQWNTGDTTKSLYVDSQGQYWLRVESEESCANADTTELQEIAYPESFDSSEITACQERVELDAGNPGASHQWNTGDTTQTLTVRTDGRYTVKIANQFCTIRDTVQVKVDVEEACPYIWVPNSFSPNGDGLNDVFKPQAQKIRDYELTVYNRWGERVFQSAKVSEGWDGSFDGKQAPTGVYLYQIVYKLRNEEGTIRLKTKEGTMQLIR